METVRKEVETIELDEQGNPKDDGTVTRFLIFIIDNQEYAVDIANVTEIINVLPITPVPYVPECIKGVVNLRGNIIPVLDVRMRFGLPVIPYTDTTNIIVMDFNEEKLGLIVDDVLEVVDISPDCIAPVDDTDDTDGFFSSVGWYGGRKQFFIDFDTFLKI